MAGFQSSGGFDLLEFIGTEEANLLASFLHLRQEIATLAQLDTLYREPIGRAAIPPSDAIVMQLLLFCHFHLYYSATTLMRRHLSEAFASVRTGIESALHAYRILEGHGTSEEYINRAKSFQQTPHVIRRYREKHPDAFPLARPLLHVHKKCSEFASHADFTSFIHRVDVIEQESTELRLQYFQGPRSVSETQRYMLMLLHTFTVALNVFESFLVQRKIVDAGWSERLRGLGSQIEDWQRQHKEAVKAKGDDAS